MCGFCLFCFGMCFGCFVGGLGFGFVLFGFFVFDVGGFELFSFGMLFGQVLVDVGFDFAQGLFFGVWWC